jgi:menaquinone-specific isochorismate synthase
MVNDQNKIIENFSDFLSDTATTIGKQNIERYLISFKLSLTDSIWDFDLNSIHQSSSKTFYFENPTDKFSLLALGIAQEISENGLGRFSSLSKKYNELKSKLITNWEKDAERFPLICGGMKFTAEHSEDEWVDFKDSDWFIPEFLIVKNHGKEDILYNFVFDGNSIKKQINKFAQRLENLFQIPAASEERVSSILSSKGLSPKDKKKWKNLISSTMEKMIQQDIFKTVVSRRADLILSCEPSWNEIKKYFSLNYPECNIFIYHSGNSTFFGASPERLMKIKDRNITIDILAGSNPRGENADADKKLEMEMISSSKLNYEHDLVLHQIKKAITKYVSKISVHKVPYKKLTNIQHLHTIVRTELLENSDIFDLIEAIYPTGAICGEPKEKALNLLKKIEEHKRGFYSGIIGYFNLNDEGDFIIGIRSALLHEKKLFAYAGCGIVEGSDPDKEFHETELKLKAILSFFDENKSK